MVRQDLIGRFCPDSRRALGQSRAALPAIVADADLDGPLAPPLAAANDFAVTPPGAKYLGAERFRVHLVGSVDPDGATHLTLRTIGGLQENKRRRAC